MDGKITLSDICDDLYKEKEEKIEGRLYRQTKEQRTNFLSMNSRYIKEIFKAMELIPYLKYIKPDSDLNKNGYEFSEKSRTFLVLLLGQYTNKNSLELRRGHMDKVSDRFIVWLVEGLYKVFKYNGVNESELAEIGRIMSDITNYPVRLVFGNMFQITYDLEQLAGRAYWPQWKTYLHSSDNCIWLNAMQKDLKLFINKWEHIYSSMGEERLMEADETAEKNYYAIKPEQAELEEMEFVLAEELNKALKNDKKLKALHAELDKEVLNKKTGYYADKQADFEYIKGRIKKRRDQVEKRVFDIYCPGMDVPEKEDIPGDAFFDNMKSSKEVLEEAIKNYQESIGPIPKINLPDINIEEVIENYKMKQDLTKKQKNPSV